MFEIYTFVHSMKEGKHTDHFAEIESWIPKRPVIIAGPCSAESEAQVLETAHQINRHTKADIFRAGIWKPRTRPSAFEGVGAKGLKWLQRVKEETGMLVATEIAKPEHAEAVLKHDIDVVWLGARTVVNPFSVQELAEALKGTDIPVMVKNPITPDINLWIGALERLYRGGVKKLAAIHRGFYVFEKSPYRNAPMWEIPIELKRKLPEMPIICDPSHIGGDRKIIAEISQKALDLAMDGLMIETHCNPDKALTDVAQQIDPLRLHNIIKELTIRTASPKDEQDQLTQLRTEIDKLDEELIRIMAQRMDIIKEIGAYKIEQEITVFQLKRWTDILNQRMLLAKDQGINPAFTSKVLKLIHQESIRIQTEMMHTRKKK